MISLTYLSTASTPFSASGLSELLDASRVRNTDEGLTGMLLYCDGHFIQTLEGDDEVVQRTFDRIAGDPRHRSILVALREEIETRAFPDWSMGFRTLDRDDVSNLPGFNDYLSGSPMSPHDAATLGRPGIFHRVFRDGAR